MANGSAQGGASIACCSRFSRRLRRRDVEDRDITRRGTACARIAALMVSKRRPQKTRVEVPRIFISYSRSDGVIVSIKVDVMRLGGPLIFRDTDSIVPGD